MEVKEYIKRYISNFHQVEREFELYKNIKLNAESKNDKVNKYSYIFITILSALQCSYILNLSKLLLIDEKKNIYKLIEQCRNQKRKFENYELLETILNEFKKELDAEEDTIYKIKLLRDKYFAHADATYFLEPDKVFKEAKLHGEKIEMIVEILNKYLEKIAYFFNCDFNNNQKENMNWDLDEILKKI